MRWGLFAIVAIVVLAFEMSASNMLEVAGLRPSLAAIVALYIALWAGRTSALWACFLLGLLIDVTSPHKWPPAQILYIIGPHALGFTFACALTLQIRAMVMRRQTIAVSLLAGVFAIAAGIVVVAIYTIRSWYAVEFDMFGPGHELLRRLGVALYTTLLGLPAGWILLRFTHAWHFQTVTTGRNTNWR